jgi:hypothetical protein
MTYQRILTKNMSTFTSHNIQIVIFMAAVIYFYHYACKIDIFILYIPLYWRLLEVDDLLLKHVGGFICMDNL